MNMLCNTTVRANRQNEKRKFYKDVSEYVIKKA